MKKSLSLLLAALLMVGVLAGCTVSSADDKSGSSDSSVSDSASDSSSDSSKDDSSSSEEDSSSSKDDGAKGDYINWTVEQWNNAGGSEKEEAALALAMYTYEQLGMSGITEDLIRPQLADLVEQFDEQFKSAPDAMKSFTLKQIVDAGTSLMSGDE